MNTKTNIRRFWMWVGILLLVDLAVITLWKRWYWFFPSHEVSEVYTRYAGNEDFNVVFLKDFKLNDTVFVDVTLLEAKNDSSWVRIKDDFNILSFPSEFPIPMGGNTVDIKYAPKHKYNAPMDTAILNNDIIAIYYYKQTITIFHIENEEQIDAIFYQQTINLKEK